MGLKEVCAGLTSAAEAGVDMAGPKTDLNPDGVALVVILAGCAETVEAIGTQVVVAEEVMSKRLPPPKLTVEDEDGRGFARIWAKAEGTEEGALDTVGCGVPIKGSDFTVPKLKAVEVMEEGVWAATDVGGARI